MVGIIPGIVGLIHINPVEYRGSVLLVQYVPAFITRKNRLFYCFSLQNRCQKEEFKTIVQNVKKCRIFLLWILFMPKRIRILFSYSMDKIWGLVALKNVH